MPCYSPNRLCPFYYTKSATASTYVRSAFKARSECTEHRLNIGDSLILQSLCHLSVIIVIKHKTRNLLRHNRNVLHSIVLFCRTKILTRFNRTCTPSESSSTSSCPTAFHIVTSIIRTKSFSWSGAGT